MNINLFFYAEERQNCWAVKWVCQLSLNLWTECRLVWKLSKDFVGSWGSLLGMVTMPLGPGWQVLDMDYGNGEQGLAWLVPPWRTLWWFLRRLLVCFFGRAPSFRRWCKTVPPASSLHARLPMSCLFLAIACKVARRLYATLPSETSAIIWCGRCQFVSKCIWIKAWLAFVRHLSVLPVAGWKKKCNLIGW